jgi:NTP pyrophosphatase (non-canonical NTP hydrolase)
MTGSQTLSGFQSEVDQTIKAAGGYWPPLANLARLFEESGEFARAINQYYGPKRRKSNEARVALEEELGDVLFVALVLANSLDIDAPAALGASIEKVKHRSRVESQRSPS